MGAGVVIVAGFVCLADEENRSVPARSCHWTVPFRDSKCFAIRHGWECKVAEINEGCSISGRVCDPAASAGHSDV